MVAPLNYLGIKTAAVVLDDETALPIEALDAHASIVRLRMFVGIDQRLSHDVDSLGLHQAGQRQRRWIDNLQGDRQESRPAHLFQADSQLISEIVAAGRWLAGGAAEPVIWIDQVSRLALLGIAGVLSTTLVLRTRELQWLSARDRLTDVINRSVFEDLLATEASRVRRGGGSVAVLLVDVDRFGAFNGLYGQAAGDRTLRLVAAAIRQATQRRGLVARYGGDEFAVMIAEPRSDGVADLAEDIRRVVATAPSHPSRMIRPEPLTVSIGIASLPQDGRDGREVCAQAEERLAQAKRAGGDRVVVADTMQGEERH